MEYSKKYIVNDNHTDKEGWLDNTYYLFCMESCRYNYLKEMLDFDSDEEAKRNIYLKVYDYKIESDGILKKGDNFCVTCSVFLNSAEKQYLDFKHSVIINDKIVSVGVFSVNFIMVSADRL
ncbi:thioesterase [Flavobacterium sp. MC2016-06]|jgi:acyl-CoA thioester hydrolase|uniref:thioesterase n=1 Tax=Flavobacterium sp. MC2016-06 TaxID=2676308 RepID=UPI0012BA8CE3|nr:thioesterase [Flavobacterium sp. MC2016-06]MBU3857767.1 thioesterase [Flavobacterium sp. MC2016-06]